MNKAENKRVKENKPKNNMEQSVHRSRGEHHTHRAHRKHRNRFRFKWFDRFKRFDEFGFVNPEYDRINLVMGKVAAALILIAFIVLLVLCFNESFPSREVY